MKERGREEGEQETSKKRLPSRLYLARAGVSAYYEARIELALNSEQLERVRFRLFRDRDLGVSRVYQ